MPKTLGDLKKAIAAFTRRSQASFVNDEGDSLLVAINHAKDFAQRSIDFERAFVQVSIAMPEPSLGGKITEARLFPEGGNFIDVKTFRKAFLQSSNGTFYYPIDMVSRQSFVDRLQQRTEGVSYLQNTSDFVTNEQQQTPQLVLQGEKFYLYPALTAATTVYFDAIKWMPDFSDVNEPHFLFTYCFDFMMFRSIYELNFLLKEDQRFAVSQSILTDVWENVRGWNATYIGNATDDTTLD